MQPEARLRKLAGCVKVNRDFVIKYDMGFTTFYAIHTVPFFTVNAPTNSSTS
jgi:hypothetical protein